MFQSIFNETNRIFNPNKSRQYLLLIIISEDMLLFTIKTWLRVMAALLALVSGLVGFVPAALSSLKPCYDIWQPFFHTACDNSKVLSLRFVSCCQFHSREAPHLLSPLIMLSNACFGDLVSTAALTKGVSAVSISSSPSRSGSA